jgi:hypothetical protein
MTDRDAEAVAATRIFLLGNRHAAILRTGRLWTYLTPRETDLIFPLVVRRVVFELELDRMLYGPAGGSPSGLRVLTCSCNKKLRPHGFRVARNKFFGYSLVRVAPVASRRWDDRNLREEKNG